MQNRSIAQTILKHAGIYSVAVIASRMASVLLLPVYTRYLKPSDYGVLELLEMTSFLFSTLIGLRCSTGWLTAILNQFGETVGVDLAVGPAAVRYLWIRFSPSAHLESSERLS